MWARLAGTGRAGRGAGPKRGRGARGRGEGVCWWEGRGQSRGVSRECLGRGDVGGSVGPRAEGAVKAPGGSKGGAKAWCEPLGGEGWGGAGGGAGARGCGQSVPLIEGRAGGGARAESKGGDGEGPWWECGGGAVG